MAGHTLAMAAPRPTGEAERGKIGTLAGLPGLSLDALTSVAYGPEAIVVVLAASGAGAIASVRPITVAIVVLLAILVFSYRQVIALTSAFPGLTSASVPLCLALLALLTVLNLFGLAESARAFLIPTLVFIAGLYAVVVVGLIHPLGAVGPTHNPAVTPSTVGVLLVLKAFASGCSALTGVEAIANGTPSFKEPRVKRAQRTELLLGVILGSLLLGLSQLTVQFHLRPKANVTLLSQIADRAVGHGIVFYVVELATTVALALAANTSFGGLPVLGSLLAGDGFLPRVFYLHGQRAVYRYGVVVLAVLAGLLIVGSSGNTQTLIPLFAIGVFIGFTLAQSGLVRHWFTHHGRLWAGRAVINGAGALLSAAAAVIFLATKFAHGAFIIVIVIPATVLLFRKIHHYYDTLGDELGVNQLPERPAAEAPGLVLVPVVGLSRLTSVVLAHALAAGGEVRALHAAFEGEPTHDLEAAWAAWAPGVPLIIVTSPERSVVQAFQAYLATPEVAAHPNIIVLIGEIEPRKLRHRLLLNQRGTILASVLRRRSDVVVATIPFRLD